MNLSDIIKNVNSYVGDSSTDRLTTDERFQSLTEATAWLLEELGNEHMTDRTEIEYLPTVTWYKVDNLTPYLMTAGQLRFKEDRTDRVDFTRVEPRDLATMSANRYAYAIERFNGDSFIGINMPYSGDNTHQDLIPFNSGDSYTYTGTNASDILKEKDAVRFDMTGTGVTATGLSTTSSAISLTDWVGDGTFVFELEIPDISNVTSVSFKFGTNLGTDYYLGTVTQDANGNALAQGLNIIKIPWSILTQVGSPSTSAVTVWQILVNHTSGKPAVDKFRLSDLRITRPIFLTFKYLFYRVGKNASGADIIEFTADTDVPFFVERYPQYRYAVAHKAAAVLNRFLQLPDNVRSEDREADKALDRYKKNFSGERDMGSTAFKVAGISFRNKRIIRRR
jgi:hypothetical protein